jgi:tape measure domain-containing protein
MQSDMRTQFAQALATGQIRAVDLTQPLEADTPIMLAIPARRDFEV